MFISILNIEYRHRKPSPEYLKAVTVLFYSNIPEIKRNNKIIQASIQKYATGTIIAKTKRFSVVLTNAHVLKNKEMKVVIGKNKYDVFIIRIYPKIDLATAVVLGDLKNKQSIKGISLNSLLFSEKVYSMGNYKGYGYFYTEGNYSGSFPNGKINGELFNLPGSYGCSGSGIFNKDGKLVGIFTAVPYIGNSGIIDTNKSFSIGVYEINRVIKNLLK